MRRDFDYYKVFVDEDFQIENADSIVKEIGISEKKIIKTCFKFLSAYIPGRKYTTSYIRVVNNTIDFISYLCQKNDFDKNEIKANKERIKKVREELLKVAKRKTSDALFESACKMDEIVLEKSSNVKDVYSLLIELIDRKENVNIIKKILDINKQVISYENGALFDHIFNLCLESIEMNSETIIYYSTLLKIVYYSNINKLYYIKKLNKTIDENTYYKYSVYDLDLYYTILGDKRGLSIDEIYCKYCMIFEFDYPKIILPKKNTIEDSIFTIDNNNTKARDDGFSIKKDGDNFIVGIHIADVGYYLEPNSNADLQALNNYRCCYLAGCNRTQILNTSMENQLSLNQNERKRVITLNVVFDKNYDVKDYYICENNIIVSKNLTYLQSDNILNGFSNNELSECLRNLYSIAIKIEKNNVERKKYWELKEQQSNNSYIYQSKSDIIVRQLMVLYNTLLAKIAKDENFPYVFRVQAGEYLSDSITSNGLDFDDESKKMIKNIYLPSKYSIEPGRHNGLNVDIYSKSSSPLIKYPSIYNQYLLHNFYFKDKKFNYDEEKFKDLIDYFNCREDELDLFKAEHDRAYKLIKKD